MGLIQNNELKKNKFKPCTGVYTDKTKTKKTIFLTLITTYGVAKNAYYKSQVQSEVMMDALFA